MFPTSTKYPVTPSPFIASLASGPRAVCVLLPSVTSKLSLLAQAFLQPATSAPRCLRNLGGEICSTAKSLTSSGFIPKTQIRWQKVEVRTSLGKMQQINGKVDRRLANGVWLNFHLVLRPLEKIKICPVVIDSL